MQKKKRKLICLHLAPVEMVVEISFPQKELACCVKTINTERKKMQWFEND